jgi:hypothetical protein
MSLALTRFLAPLVPLALLAACGDEPAEDGDGRSASGEVLEGTISDAMLPLDQVQSEPPLLAPEQAPAARDASGPGAAGGADEAGDEEAETADEPAASEAEEPETDEAPAAE